MTFNELLKSVTEQVRKYGSENVGPAETDDLFGFISPEGTFTSSDVSWAENIPLSEATLIMGEKLIEAIFLGSELRKNDKSN